jgi:hypothetical protein
MDDATYLSVQEMARKKKISDKRVLQLLAQDPKLKARCLILGEGRQRPHMILLPPNLLDGYKPVPHLQAAGFARAKARKKKAALVKANHK